MAVYNSNSKAGPFIADGSQKEFPFRFPILETDHIAVYAEGEVLHVSRYYVETSGIGPGGTVVFYEPPAEGSRIAILRDVPLTQETDIQNNTAFNPEVLESSLDKLTMICQQNREELQRCVKVSTTSDTNPGDYLDSIVKEAQNSKVLAAASEKSAAEYGELTRMGAAAAADSATLALRRAEEAEASKESAMMSAKLAMADAEAAEASEESAMMSAKLAMADAEAAEASKESAMMSANLAMADAEAAEASKESAMMSANLAMAEAEKAGNSAQRAEESAERAREYAENTGGASESFVNDAVAAHDAAANAHKTLFDSKLDKSGGTLTGGILFSNDDAIVRKGTAGRLAILGGEGFDSNASIVLHGGDDAELDGNGHSKAGCVALFAYDSKGNKSSLMLKPTGELFKDGASVVSVINSWHVGGNWYRQYSDGFIEQGGMLFYSSEDGERFVTLNIPFTTRTYFATAQSDYIDTTDNGWDYVTGKTETAFSAIVTEGIPYWYACGY